MKIDWTQFESQDELRDRDEEWWDKFESGVSLTEEPLIEKPSLEPSPLRARMGQLFDPQAKFPQIQPEGAEVVREMVKDSLFGELPAGLGYLQKPLEEAVDYWGKYTMSEEEEMEMARKHPNLMAARYAAGSLLLPGVSEYITSAVDWREFSEKSIEEQRLEILGTTAAYVTFGAGFKWGTEALGALGKAYPWMTKPIITALKEANWFRRMTNKERGLVAQTINDMKNAGLGDAQILKNLRKRGSPEYKAYFREAVRKRATGEMPSTAEPIIPPVKPAKYKPGEIIDTYAERDWAVELKNGRIVANKKAVNHSDLVERMGIDPEDVADAGFVIKGKFASWKALRLSREGEIAALKAAAPTTKVAEELKAAIEKEREVSPLGVLREKISKIEEAAKVEKEAIRKKFEEKKVRLRAKLEEPEELVRAKLVSKKLTLMDTINVDILTENLIKKGMPVEKAESLIEEISTLFFETEKPIKTIPQLKKLMREKLKLMPEEIEAIGRAIPGATIKEEVGKLAKEAKKVGEKFEKVLGKKPEEALRAKLEEKPTATYLGQHTGVDVYNIKGGKLDGSTVTKTTLEKEGIEIPKTPKKPPPEKKKVAEHRVLPGTQKGLYTNYILQDKEGNIYEGDVGEHMELIRDFGLKLEDISRVGIVQESGEYSLKKASSIRIKEWERTIRSRDRGELEAELDIPYRRKPIVLEEIRKKKKQQKDDTIDLFSGIPFHKFDKEIIDPLKNLYLRHVGDPLWNFLTETLPVKAGKKSRFIDYINKQTWVMGLRPEYRKDPKFVDLRDDTQMRIQQYRARARELAEVMAKFPRAEQIRIAQIIRGGVTATPKRYKAAFETIQRFQELEKDLHELGILGPDNRFRQLTRKEVAGRFKEIAVLDKQIEKFQKRKGKAKDVNKLMDKRSEILERIRLHYRMSGKLYLRRSYEKIEAEKKFIGRLLSHLRKRGPKLVKGYEKRRKDLSKEYRQYLGEIEPAPFLAYKGLSEESHDVELMKMFVKISQNKDWAISPEEWANIQAVKRRQHLIKKYENFKPLPVTVKLGPLSGALVDPYIWDDLNQAVEIKGDLLKAWDDVLRLWKTGKVVYNPATQCRNVLSNSVLAWGGNLPPWRIDIYARAARDFYTKSGYWLEATKNTSLLGKEWAAVEAIDFLKAASQLKQGNWLTASAKLVAKYLDKPGEMYQFWEQFFKLAVYTNERLNGATIRDAYKQAEEWLFNYQKIPPAIRWAKRWYSPFITFSFKALPKIAKMTIRTPWRMASILILFAAVEEITRRMRGESKEEVEREKRVLPDYMRRSVLPGQLSHLRVPYTDKWGRSKYLDLSFILPWGDVAEQWGQSHLVGRPFLPSHPLWVVIGEIGFNEILFTGQDLTIKDLDEGADYWKRIGTQLWRQAMPSFAGSYSYNKIMSAMRSEKDWVGRERSVEEAIFDTFFGLKIRSVDYYEALDRRINELDKYKEELKKRFRRDYRKLIMNPTPDRDYDERRQRKLLKKLNEDVERIINKTWELQK